MSTNWTRLAGEPGRFPTVCCVYVLRSPTARLYVGKSVNLQSRMRQHIHNIANGQGKIYNSFRKHGTENWDIRWLPAKDDDSALRWERILIKRFGTNSPEHLNCTDGGDGSSGYVQTAEARKKLSEAHKGKKHSPESVRKRAESNRGRKRSEEMKAKMSRAKELGHKRRRDAKYSAQVNALAGVGWIGDSPWEDEVENAGKKRKMSIWGRMRQSEGQRLRRLREKALKQWQSGWLMI